MVTVLIVNTHVHDVTIGKRDTLESLIFHSPFKIGTNKKKCQSMEGVCRYSGIGMKKN